MATGVAVMASGTRSAFSRARPARPSHGGGPPRPRVRRDGVRVKLEPAGGGYVRVTGVRT